MTESSLEIQRAFLSARHFAVVGASKDQTKYGTRVLKWYQKETELEGLSTIKSLDELREPLETAVSIVTPPKITLGILQSSKALNVPVLWLQPGAEDEAVRKYVEEAGLQDRVVLGGPCVLRDGDEIRESLITELGFEHFLRDSPSHPRPLSFAVVRLFEDPLKMAEKNSTKKTIKDLTAGTAGGILQASRLISSKWCVSMPSKRQFISIVDMVAYTYLKRMQTASKGTYSGMLHCAAGILRNEGPLAFYKGTVSPLLGIDVRVQGTVSPLLGIGVCVSIQFGALEYTKRALAQMNIKSGRGGPDGKELTGGQLVFAGSVAGLANSVVSGPVEHIRIRLQIQATDNKIYSGPADAVKKIMSQHGIAGIYKGQVPTLAREGIGYGAYFWAYEKLMQREQRKGVRREDVSPVKAVLFGAAAGYALWFCVYPIDMIKSRMQTDGFTSADGRKYQSMLDCVRTVWRTEGINAFTRGLVPTLIRSPFANGATFLGFELASRALEHL
ncbi:mitochondrial carrier [Sanghuangporus baumii]|uniref:Mitochondrial carrier n=1 Tax=Sanghuangporus baumii TaxID=108892 RepID=A0A9Q5HWT2_SANBA|nr:mitochondrial carrier [Sanghuangporus baumii]